MYLRTVTPADIQGVSERWKRQYFKSDEWQSTSHSDSEQIYNQLKALPPTATAADVRTIIGNDSWVGFLCRECSSLFNRHEIVIGLGDVSDADHDNNLCLPCIEKLAIFVKGVKEAVARA
jgi:hypothetical protein